MTVPPSPQRPRRQRSMIAGVVLGISLVAIVGVLPASAARFPQGVAQSASTPSQQVATTGVPKPRERVTPTDVLAIHDAMQTFVAAVNSRDVLRLRAAVCSSLRPRVTSPFDLPGSLVLEDMQNITIVGESAESRVLTHLQAGTARSDSKPNDENFVREHGTWYMCPGARPDAVA